MEDEYQTPPGSPRREESTFQYLKETVVELGQLIQEKICGRQSFAEPDFTDGRNTRSSGGRPPSECRAPMRPIRPSKLS
jgi:hypothetical protein